jgi:hypothetical protein
MPFKTGFHYTDWSEAVIRNVESGQAIFCPCKAMGALHC